VLRPYHPKFFFKLHDEQLRRGQSGKREADPEKEIEAENKRFELFLSRGR
jgi:hypothetical protein